MDELEPLWKALHEHHAAVAPELAGLKARSSDESWVRRRAAYNAWLKEPGAFGMIAERGGEAVGYAIVRLRRAITGWSSGERVAVLESLSVLPKKRGEGVGAALLDAVERELACRGVEELLVGVIRQNERAIRFYERRGLTPYLVYFLGRIEPAGGERSG